MFSIKKHHTDRMVSVRRWVEEARDFLALYHVLAYQQWLCDGQDKQAYQWPDTKPEWIEHEHAQAFEANTKPHGFKLAIEQALQLVTPIALIHHKVERVRAMSFIELPQSAQSMPLIGVRSLQHGKERP